MYDWSPVVAAIARVGIKNSPPEEGDYEREDGILMCGKCHTPRRTYLDANGRLILVPIPCECRKAEEAAQKLEEKRQKDFEAMQNLKKGSLIDSKFKDCTFATCKVVPDNRQQVKLCKSYADRFEQMMEKNQGLLLYGNVGTGKSYLSACIANNIMERLHTVCATSMVKIMDLARDFNAKETLSNLEAKMMKADLLILDDLGTESESSYAKEIVYRVIDGRYRVKKPMVITTNLTLDAMQNCLDMDKKRVYDRVLEVCYPMQFNGKSFRQLEAKNRFDAMRALLEG
jgi:DNA replication protein DnaC